MKITNLRQRLKELEDGGLLTVWHTNKINPKNSDTIAIGSGYSCGTAVTKVDCTDYSCEPAAKVVKPSIEVFVDDTDESLSARLKALESQMIQYKAFIVHRSDSPVLAESLYYQKLYEQIRENEVTF